jgi:glycosyltransferase involved in cell wall biosynthesis
MKKKICFVVSSPITAKAFLINHIRELSKDHDVYLAANFEKEDQTTFKETPLKGIIHLPIYRNVHILKDIVTLLKVIRCFRKEQFDVVHSVTPKAGLLAMVGANIVGIKKRIHVFTGQVWYTKKGLFKLLLKFLDHVIVFNATHILVDGLSQQQFLISNKIISQDNSRVLGKGSISGVDTKRFSPNKEIRRNIREQLGYFTNDVVYIYLGRFNHDKGLLDLAYSFEKLSSKYMNSKLLMVGFDEEKIGVQIQKIVSNNKAVQFIEPTLRPQDYLQASDVFCLPSYREGFGTSIIEASSTGLPIICSNTYGLKGTILDNVTGLYHNVGDSYSLFEKMILLHTDEEFRNGLGINGVNFVKANFNATMITKEWLNFYEQILA